MNGGADFDALRAEVRMGIFVVIILACLIISAVFFIGGDTLWGSALAITAVIGESILVAETSDGYNRQFWSMIRPKEDGQYIGDHLPDGDGR